MFGVLSLRCVCFSKSIWYTTSDIVKVEIQASFFACRTVVDIIHTGCTSKVRSPMASPACRMPPEDRGTGGRDYGGSAQSEHRPPVFARGLSLVDVILGTWNSRIELFGNSYVPCCAPEKRSKRRVSAPWIEAPGICVKGRTGHLRVLGVGLLVFRAHAPSPVLKLPRSREAVSAACYAVICRI